MNIGRSYCHVFRVLVLLGLSCLVGKEIASQENATWPQWGGPKRNFTSSVKGLTNCWPPAGPRQLWSRPWVRATRRITVQLPVSSDTPLYLEAGSLADWQSGSGSCGRLGRKHRQDDLGVSVRRPIPFLPMRLGEWPRTPFNSPHSWRSCLHPWHTGTTVLPGEEDWKGYLAA